VSAKLLTGVNDSALITLVNPATSCAGALPTNRAVGDILIAFVASQTALGTGQSFTETSGTWTQLGPTYPLNSGKRPVGVWIKTIPDSATLAALTAPNFQSSATGRWIVRISRITGADLSAPVDGASSSYETVASTTSCSLANAPIAKGNTLAFAVVHGVNTAGQQNPNWGPAPAGFTTAYADNTTANGTASNDSLYVATETVAIPATLTGVVVTVSNAQTTLNGFMVSIASTPSPTQTPHVWIYDGSSEQLAYATVWDGSAEQPVESMRPYAGDQTVTTLFAKQPFYIAHRGGSASYPEETVYGYTQCANMMMRALEISVWRSSDGVFVCSHDKNLSRVTGQNIDIPTTAWSAMSGLMVNPVGTDNQGQPPRPLARIEDVLSRYGFTHSLWVEDKSGVNGAALLDILDAYGGPSRHVWKAAGPFSKQAIVTARGYKAWGYYFVTDFPNFDTSFAPWDFLGLDYAMSDAQVQHCVATGKPSVSHIIANTAQRDRMLGLGCVGSMTSAVDVVFPH